jgi:hypothetical protein
MPDPDLAKEILNVLRADGKLAAVKLYRQRVPSAGLQAATNVLSLLTASNSMKGSSLSPDYSPNVGRETERVLRPLPTIQVRRKSSSDQALRPWHIASVNSEDACVVSADFVVFCLTKSGEISWVWRAPTNVYGLKATGTGGVYILLFSVGIVELDRKGSVRKQYSIRDIGKGAMATDADGELVCVDSGNKGLYFFSGHNAPLRVQEGNISTLVCSPSGKYVACVTGGSPPGGGEDRLRIYNRAGALLLDDAVCRAKDIAWVGEKLLVAFRDYLTVREL